MSHYLGDQPSNKRGKILGPKEQLGPHLNRTAIIEALNSRPCFDFDYQPQEKDRLLIKTAQDDQPYAYFSLLYEHGKWGKGNYAAFGQTLSEDFAQGKIALEEDTRED